MKLKKNDIMALVAVAILLVVYNVLAFAIPFVKNATFWTAYIFTLVAILAQVPLLYMAFRRGDSPKSKIYGFPVARVGVLYLGIQLAIGFVSMIVAKWLPVAPVAIVCVILMGAAGLGFIAAETMRDEIERQDVKIVKDVAAMRELQSKTAALPGMCSDAEAVKALTELAEAMRFSDPVTSDATREAEQNLKALVDVLQQAVVDGDNASTVTLCKRCTLALGERNRLCKLSKTNI